MKTIYNKFLGTLSTIVDGKLYYVDLQTNGNTIPIDKGIDIQTQSHVRVFQTDEEE